MKKIKKIKLKNYKKFDVFESSFNDSINLLIGDNEAGKSSILSAIDLVLAGSRSKLESVGLSNIFNTDCIKSFLASGNDLNALPDLFIEVYLEEGDNHDLNGKNNSDNITTDGLKLYCGPSQEFLSEIADILKETEASFPFEYYSIKFTTFAGEPYYPHKKYLNHILLDSTQINTEYAVRQHVSSLYNASVDGKEKHAHQHYYRNDRIAFKNSVLKDLNIKIDDYDFELRNDGKNTLESELTITEEGIPIESKGKGRQCFIKTEFALNRKTSDNKRELHAILLEEPENHLSHTNMKKLIMVIDNSNSKQLFIATHSSLVSSRLDLKNAILLSSNSNVPLSLSDLDQPTADFFMKAPDNNVLEFVLSKKIILVEGDAEFILIEAMYQKLYGISFDESNVHIISIGGTAFKRYLNLATALDIKTAVIRDNDGDYEKNCKLSYNKYNLDNIKIFADSNNENYTFEVCLYQNNVDLCEKLFSKERKVLSVQDYMLSNKTEAAFKLLKNYSNELVVPNYIQEAFEWIKK
jgi:predicted ATP-dependent endonuclease of OLD family